MTNWRLGLHTKDQRIWLDFPFDKTGKIKEALKASVPGTRWDKKEKFWTFPLDMQSGRDIEGVAKKFKAKLIVEPELASWVKEQKKRFKQVIQPDNLTADFSQLLPRVRKEYPHIIQALERKPWQIPGAAFIAEQRKILLADKPGLGKTLQVITAILEADIKGPILVVAPKSAVTATWPDELREWLGEDEVFYSIHGDYTPKVRELVANAAYHWTKNLAFPDRTWILISPNYIRIRADVDQYGNYVKDSRGKKIINAVNETIPRLFDIDYQAVIVDESHQTLATSKGDRKKWSAQRLGLCSIDTPPNGIRVCVSGTPFRGKTDNIWGTLNWLYPEKYTSLWNFIKRHYGVLDQTSYGGSIVKGEQIIDEAKFFKELKPLMVRRTKKEVAPWLPDKQYGGTHLDPSDKNSPVAVWLPMTDKQMQQYQQVMKEALLSLDFDTLNVNGCLAEMIRYKQLANSALGNELVTSGAEARPMLPSNKLNWLIDFLYERQTAGTKVIVASQFTKFLEMVSVFLRQQKIDHYLFTGKTTGEARNQIKKDFQGDGDLVLLLNTQSGGSSLTLDAADDVVICDQTWIPDEQEQVEDRADRAASDRVHQVTIWYLSSLGTIDEDIAILNNDRELQTSLIDRQRGVNYVKALVAATRNRAGKIT